MSRTITIAQLGCGYRGPNLVRNSRAQPRGNVKYVPELADGDQLVNLSTSEEIRISNRATLSTEAVGFKGENVWDSSKPNGQPRHCLDVMRAKELFGFQAKVPFHEGIRKP